MHPPEAVDVPEMIPSNPTSHSQRCASLEPTGPTEFAGHARQESVDMTFLNVFLAQATHVPEASTLPVIVPSVLGRHRQSDAAVLGSVAVLDFSGQALHALCPLSALNWPTGHAVHVPVALYVPIIDPENPASHKHCEAAVLSAGLELSAGHARHACDPIVALNFPAGQATHDPAALLSPVILPS